MLDFTDKEAIRKIDPQDTFGSTEQAVQQFKAAWNEVQKVEIKDDYRALKNIVFCGMGASIYGALVLKAVEGKDLPPVELVSDYHLPNYVNHETLVVLTSYSGTTEEVLSCAEEAKEKGAKMLVLTKGGPLADFAKNNNITSYIFDGKLNPAGIPRLGNGYTILGLLGLFSKAKIISLEEQEIADSLTRLEEKLPELKQKAESDFALFRDHIPVIFAGEHLSGNAQILRNQFNETSKTFSSLFLIPDLNHHLMEGLQFPVHAPLYFTIFNSKNYSPKIQKRVQLTIEVVEKNNHHIHVFETNGQTVYDDFLETIIYGSYLTLYLALSYDQNPAINPWVDWFKEQLK